MRHVSDLSIEEALRLRALLFDLDDTLLDGTHLSEAAFSGLYRLRESGLVLVAVTGRPSGWGELLVRQWPIDGAVTENGAVSCALVDGRLAVQAHGGAAARRAELSTIVERIRSAFPDLRPTDDNHARRTDYTFDIGEHERVVGDEVERVRVFARSLGARSTASSVHLHVTLEAADKASGAVGFLARRFGWDPTEAMAVSAFIGDSDNDEACFGAFRTTIAVRNFRGKPT